MERSSPLAAMQPPSMLLGHCGFRSDASTSYPAFPRLGSFEPSSFNFKDLSMKRSQSDYFTMKPARGSSPTASLAADLSQNFHIDQSPQLPTPRRSLFQTNFLGGFGGRASVTTPPIPSSSPGPVSDSMEISPLPHKVPYASAIPIQLQSPTPELTPADSILSLPSPISDSPLDSLRIAPERKRPNPIRPSLTRTKGLSTSCIPSRPSAESQLPPFRFGNGSSKLTSSTSMTLAEAFVSSSPPQERSLGRNNSITSMGPPRPRQPFGGMKGTGCSNGSPVSGHVRKNSNPFARPRKQFRRSLSMYEHPQDMMRAEKSPFDSALPSIMDVEAGHILQLPHFLSDDQAGSLPRIEKGTMIDVLDGKYQGRYDEVVVIDCRFEYEYEGGHINGAVNFNDKELLASKLFESGRTSKALLVFHCEYSAHRAPIMAKFIRHKDRAVNADCYPNLIFPELYILDGGYSSFFSEFRSRCFPQNYVEMGAKEHSRACERGMGKVKQRSKLIRAQTFAFGQHSAQVEDSPTAPNRSRSDLDMLDMDVDMGLGQTLDLGRRHAQRMSSF